MTKRYEVSYAETAEADLAALHRYLYLNASPEIAEQKLIEIDERVRALSQFPERGSIPSELGIAGSPAYRQIVHASYRVVYRVEQAQVVVLIVTDGRRDMQALLRQRLLTPPGSPR